MLAWSRSNRPNLPTLPVEHFTEAGKEPVGLQVVYEWVIALKTYEEPLAALSRDLLGEDWKQSGSVAIPLPN